MIRRSLLLVVAALLLPAASCNGNGKDAAPPTSSTTSSSTPSSTASTSSPTTTGGQIVVPDTSGEDFVSVVGGLNTLLNLVYDHPDRPDLLDLIFEPGGSARANVESQVTSLRTKGWRYADEGSTVTNIAVQQRASTDTALVGLVTAQGPQVVVDGTGAVVQRGDGWKPRREQLTLKRGGDGRWRIVTMVVNGPA